MYDIIPDIHGQADKLKAALTNLGYQDRNGAWRHSEPDRRVVFLGDFIDRGPRNGQVLSIVRRMLDVDTAHAIMGNHELNAIHFHTRHPETGEPLRPHSEKNLRQHESFLHEFPIGDSRTSDVIGWMKTLPLFLEFEGFRVVHACWNDAVIGNLRQHTAGGILDDGQVITAADKDSELFSLVETTTKGPEVSLPEGYSITDKDVTVRREVRVKWWHATPASWADIAISVPNTAELPDTPLPACVDAEAYPVEAKPVFFGHYWLDGAPVMQAPNALCLDYSAGKNGPLMSYSVGRRDKKLDIGNLMEHPRSL